MFYKLIDFSVRNKFIIGFFMVAWIGAGIWAMMRLPLDAVPDITNNQVQVVTVSPTLAPQEIELRVTMPVEQVVSNIPGVVETRSISRYGLSVITIVFEDDVPILDARQYVKEQLAIAGNEIPIEDGTPELMPITTGLGEIYQYTLNIKPGYESQYDLRDLRTLQDWIIKRRLAGTNGLIEVSSFGGLLKQYEVAVNPELLANYNITLNDVFFALERNNQNSGGSYIENGSKASYIRTIGTKKSISEIENILIKNIGGFPLLIKHIAKVQFGSPKRYGAMTMDGNGEVVGGIALMFKGANSSQVLVNIKDRINEIKKSLPEGITIQPYMDRSVLVSKTIRTVSRNLIEGGLIVIFVLVLLLGNWRAGWIVASVIPLSMLFAFIMMHVFGVSANLMSLGAIDFGIVVDGAVIIVESVLHTLVIKFGSQTLSKRKMDDVIISSTASIYRSAAFGVLIILVVFIPIISLTGIEGKMFTPMAQTISFAIIGAAVLSLTYVPAISATFLNRNISNKKNISDKIIDRLKNIYKPLLIKSIYSGKKVILFSIVILGLAVYIFSRTGGEFIPTLDEGDLAMQMSLKPGSSLSESIRTSTKVEQILKKNFPEVKHVVSKIGTSEVPTDPMAIEETDIMILLKEKEEWVSATSREELVQKMKNKLSEIKWASFEFSQPIQLRFNELMTGSKADVSVKIFGNEPEQLALLGNKAKNIIKSIQGVADVKVEQTEGLTQFVIEFNDTLLSQYNISIEELNAIIRSAYAGVSTGVVFEGEKRFDLVVRFDSLYRQGMDLSKLSITTKDGNTIPFSLFSKVNEVEGPMMISHEDAKRRINIGVNIRNRDIAGAVNEIQEKLNKKLALPETYYITYGGQFENLQAAVNRLLIVVPVSLLLIFMLLYFAFNSIKNALLIFTAVPFAAVGGIVALWMRDMPFSISAGVGFIALFGVAVLNGIVLIGYINDIRAKLQISLKTLVIEAGISRLRPVLMTALVASLGFLPMALSSSAGAEVQKPLATVVIGGLITSTLLTLFVLPILYILVNQNNRKRIGFVSLLFILFLPQISFSQTNSLEQLTNHMLVHNPRLKIADVEVNIMKGKLTQQYNPDVLSVNYTNGQLNSSANDYLVEVFHTTGNILQTIRSKNAIRSEILSTEAQKVKVQQELLFTMESLWYKGIYQTALESILKEKLKGYQSLLTEIEKASTIGEYSYTDLLVIKQKINSLELTLSQEVLNKNEVTMNLKNVSCWFDSLVLPSQFPQEILVSTTDSMKLNSTLLHPIKLKMQALNKWESAQKSEWFPRIGFGYFNQQLDYVKGFNGVKFGIEIPLTFRSTNSKIKELKLESEILTQVYTQEENRIRNLIVTIDSKIDVIQKSLLKQKQLSEYGKGIIEGSKELLIKGEIDFREFLMNIDLAYESDLNLLKLQEQYLLLVTELNYLTK